METITVKLTQTKQSRLSEVDFDNLPFGRVFSDHMFVLDYEDGQWKEGEIVPFDYLQMNPASLVLHYGQAIFEGMKAERGPEGEVILFRPELNIERFNRSAIRMAMPEVPTETFLTALRNLIDLDRNWIPTKEGCSLYLRPFMYASDEFIGVQPSSKYKFIIFTCPVGAYYSKPVSVYIEDHYIRAAAGGTGFAKAAGNYAASLYPSKLAKAQGFDQILWTDAKEHKYVQEIGTMNVFFIIDGKIVTPELTDCILPGTTRKTLIELFENEGHQVEQRPVTVAELFEAHDAGKLEDCFGAGTAAVISPISKLGTKDRTIELPAMETRTISNNMKKRLVNIKRGLSPDEFDWLVKF